MRRTRKGGDRIREGRVSTQSKLQPEGGDDADAGPKHYNCLIESGRLFDCELGDELATRRGTSNATGSSLRVSSVLRPLRSEIPRPYPFIVHLRSFSPHLSTLIPTSSVASLVQHT
jgi:hypothetical protein